MRQYLTSGQFRQLAPKNLTQFRKECGADACVIKHYVAKAEMPMDPEDDPSDDDKRPRKIAFTISTGDIDREGDTISVNGWDFANYMMNPVVLWSHDYYMPPVAIAESVTVQGSLVRSVAEFPPKGFFEWSDFLWNAVGGVKRTDGSLYRFVYAASVGMLPREWSYVDGEDGRWGIDFIKQELLEWSLATVPALPQALGDSIEADESIQARIAEQILRSTQPPALRVFPRLESLKRRMQLVGPLGEGPAVKERRITL